jgi:hypothetical protein
MQATLGRHGDLARADQERCGQRGRPVDQAEAAAFDELPDVPLEVLEDDDVLFESDVVAVLVSDFFSVLVSDLVSVLVSDLDSDLDSDQDSPEPPARLSVR